MGENHCYIVGKVDNPTLMIPDLQLSNLEVHLSHTRHLYLSLATHQQTIFFYIE